MSDIDQALINAEVLEDYYLSNGWDAIKEETDMDTFGYRFLRLNSQTLALVELYPSSYLPEVCLEIYVEFPYINNVKIPKVTSFKELEEWKEDCRFGFQVAVRTAKFYPILDYSEKLKTEEREIVLWNLLDPLTFWDEFVPLFDNDYNLILRD